jgi:hypothetical protein
VGGRLAASMRDQPKPPPQVRWSTRPRSCRACSVTVFAHASTHVQVVAGAGAGALALAVLAPAGPPQLTVLGHLEQDDK